MPLQDYCVRSAMDWSGTSALMAHSTNVQSFCASIDVWHPPAVQVPQFEAMTRGRAFTKGIGLPGRVWEIGKPTWIPDVTTDANFPRADIACTEGLHGAFAFPIMLGQQFLGVVEFFSRQIREPDADLLEMIATVGGQVGQFIERKRSAGSAARK